MSDEEDIFGHDLNGHHSSESHDKRLGSSNNSDLENLLHSPTRKTEDKSGKFLLRAATKEDPLHFIHRIVQSKDVQDEKLEEFVTLVRSTDTNSNQDENNTDNLRNLLTAALIKQFEHMSSPSSSKKDVPETSDSPGPADHSSSESETETESDIVEEGHDYHELEIEDEPTPMELDETEASENDAVKDTSKGQLELDLMAELQLKVKVTEEVNDEDMDDLNQSEDMTDKFEDKNVKDGEKILPVDGSNETGIEAMDVLADLETVTDKIDGKKLREVLIQMATHLHFGTGRNAYEIHIRPLKEKQDIEDIQISVQSLINSYEGPTCRTKDCTKFASRTTSSKSSPHSQSNEIQITIDRDKETAIHGEKYSYYNKETGICGEKYAYYNNTSYVEKQSLLPDLIVSSHSKSSDTTDKRKDRDFEDKYSKSLKTVSESDPQFLLYKTLRDIFDGQERDKQLNVKSSSDHKLQRLKISKKQDRSVSSLFKVEDTSKDMVGTQSAFSQPSLFNQDRSDLSTYLGKFTDKLEQQEHAKKKNKVYWSFDPYNTYSKDSKDLKAYDVTKGITKATNNDGNVYKSRNYGRKEDESENRSTKESISCQEVLNIVLIESTTECDNGNNNNKSNVIPWRRGAKNNRQRPSLPWQFENQSSHNHFKNPPYVNVLKKDIVKPYMKDIITSDDHHDQDEKVIKFASDLTSETADDEDEDAIFTPLEEILSKFGSGSRYKKEQWLEDMCNRQEKSPWLECKGDAKDILPYKTRRSSLETYSSKKTENRGYEMWKPRVIEDSKKVSIEMKENGIHNSVLSLNETDNYITAFKEPTKQASILKSTRINTCFNEIDNPQLKKVCKRVSFAEPEGETKKSSSSFDGLDLEAIENSVTAASEDDLQKIEAKDKPDASDTSGDDYEYDFSAIEPHSSPLNVEASKQRALLRQKGSLAGRRKPTRASLRATANTEPQIIETVAVNDRNQEKLLNGEQKDTDSTANRQTDEVEETIKQDTNTSQAQLSQGPMLSTGKMIQGVKTAIVLPGLNEINANKTRLKPKKAPVPLPKDKTPKSGAENEDGSSAPWLMEAKLRRQSKPPRGEYEKLQQEAEPERPAWMKDAEMKRKRASNFLTEKDQQKEQKNQDNEEEQDRPVAPWMREAQLRKINRPGPITMSHKEILNSIDNNTTTLEHENPFKDQLCQSPPPQQQQKLGSLSNGLDKRDSGAVISSSSSSSNSYIKAPLVNNKSKELDNKTSVVTSSREGYLSPKSNKSNREILQPIKKPDTVASSSQSSLDYRLEQDENKPPTTLSSVESSKESPAILRTKEIPPVKAHLLPPLKNPAKIPCSDLSNEDSVAPSPTSSVVMREKPGTPIKPVMKRPITMGPVVDSPMKMFETPKWKKDLMDKKKKRESLNPVTVEPESTVEVNDVQLDPALPPWKRELELRKSKRSSFRPVLKAEESTEKSTEEEVPDWIKQVQRRRSRYSEAGLTKENEIGDP